ncbi:MAG: SDR family NAD(P)-dependent oxidoreductase [Angustibacter sp.]
MPATDAPDRIALVTGAGRGIGRAVAVRLSETGRRVALTARSREELEATAAACSGPTLVLPADLTAADAVEGLFTAVEAEWGPVRDLVLNAGAGVSGRVHRTSDADWQRMLDLNLTAPFRCLRRALPSMLDAGDGRVVAIASVAAKVGEPYIAAYTASKHGLLGLVRSAAAEVASSGVTVNAVCPGYVDTPMTEATVAGIVAATGRTAEQARESLERKQPTGRLVTPDEVADVVLLCLANGSITGQGINVDGGAVQS